MFLPFNNGSCINVQGLDCYLPPEGYIVDWTTCKQNKITKMLDPNTGKLKKIGIHQRRPKHTDCFWEVDTRWASYKDWRKEELKQQKYNPDYVHPELAEFISEMFLYRFGGFWFLNNGIPTYITGHHWYYLSVIQLDTGLPDYRNEDRLFHYHYQHSEEDPLCLGDLLLTKRRFGKTYTGGGLALDYTTNNTQFNSGIQSKTEKDAKDAFRKAIVAPYRKLPYFFQVKNSNIASSGKMPEKELRFIGSVIADIDDELDSKIDFRPSSAVAYDGAKVKFYYDDEVGKPQDVDINERWDVVQWCLKDHNGNKIGMSLHTTTVEDMDGSADAFLKMWLGSDQTKKESGRTQTSLNRYFVSAIKVRCLDKYGFADEELARSQIMANRRAKQGDSRALSAEIRKEPITVEEAFLTDSKNCPFDPMILNGRDEILIFTQEKLYEVGNFHWKDNIPYGEAVWVENPNGRWLIAEHPPVHLRNAKTVQHGVNYPANDAYYAGGVDTYDHKFIEEKDGSRRLSDGAIVICKKPDTIYPSRFDNGPVLFYLGRRPDPKDFYMDTMLSFCYYGCQGLVETNKPGLQNEMDLVGFEKYSAILPGKSEAGINSLGTSNNFIFELTDAFISHFIDTVNFPRLIKDWLKFDATNTTKFDAAMAFGLSRILIEARKSKAGRTKAPVDIKSIVPGYRR